MQDHKSTETFLSNSEDELVEGETNLYRISSSKYTPPGINDKLRNLYETLTNFYHIAHRIRNPSENSS